MSDEYIEMQGFKVFNGNAKSGSVGVFDRGSWSARVASGNHHEAMKALQEERAARTTTLISLKGRASLSLLQPPQPVGGRIKHSESTVSPAEVELSRAQANARSASKWEKYHINQQDVIDTALRLSTIKIGQFQFRRA